MYYAHFDEHSSDTIDFVDAIFKYCKKSFEFPVFTKKADNSILGFYRKIGSIVPPMSAACTKILKIFPIAKYMESHEIDYDLIGYVRGEENRVKRQIKRGAIKKLHPITHITDKDCFDLVRSEIGWYPSIYDITWRDKRIIEAIESGALDWLADNQMKILKKYSSRGYGYTKRNIRVFKHNNCLPCKNMHAWELATVQIFFPKYFNDAMKTAEELDKYFGRLGEFSDGMPSSCTYCSFD